MMNDLTKAAIDLLKDLIEIPSFSKQEHKSGDRIEKWFDTYGIPFERYGNNIYLVKWSFNIWICI